MPENEETKHENAKYLFPELEDSELEAEILQNIADFLSSEELQEDDN